MITTPLTRLLNIRVPVVLAPMAGVSGGQSYSVLHSDLFLVEFTNLTLLSFSHQGMLAAAVSKAGGFGFIAAVSITKK